jgi:hypothetical protein
MRAVFVFSFLWATFLSNAATSQDSASTIYFKALKGFDVEKKKSNAEVDALVGKKIRIPGFMVPLEYKSQKVTEFLLVQSLPSCIHVPPPSPNQTIMVKMKDKKTVSLSMDPIWVTGILKLVKQDKYTFGDAVYSIEGESSAPVDSKDFNKVGLFMGDQIDMAPLEENPFGGESKTKKKK